MAKRSLSLTRKIKPYSIELHHYYSVIRRQMVKSAHLNSVKHTDEISSITVFYKHALNIFRRDNVEWKWWPAQNRRETTSTFSPFFSDRFFFSITPSLPLSLFIILNKKHPYSLLFLDITFKIATNSRMTVSMLTDHASHILNNNKTLEYWRNISYKHKWRNQ